MNTRINDLKQKKTNVQTSLKEELELSYNYYLKSHEEDFKVEDQYLKFLLLSLYRSIEDLIKILVEERKINSQSRDFYNVICTDKKTHFIENKVFKLIFADVKINDLEIKYTDIFNYICTSELSSSSSNLKITNISEIRPSSSNHNDLINIDNFYQKYNDCKINRNKLMHSITSSINLSKDAVNDAFFTYSFIVTILNIILK